MTKIHISLTEQQIIKLQRLSKKTGMGVSELVRRALDQFFETDGGKD